jgi:hypothetical protein
MSQDIQEHDPCRNCNPCQGCFSRDTDKCYKEFCDPCITLSESGNEVLKCEFL